MRHHLGQIQVAMRSDVNLFKSAECRFRRKSVVERQIELVPQVEAVVLLVPPIRIGRKESLTFASSS